MTIKKYNWNSITKNDEIEKFSKRYLDKIAYTYNSSKVPVILLKEYITNRALMSIIMGGTSNDHKDI